MYQGIICKIKGFFFRKVLHCCLRQEDRNVEWRPYKKYLVVRDQTMHSMQWGRKTGWEFCCAVHIESLAALGRFPTAFHHSYFPSLFSVVSVLLCANSTVTTNQLSDLKTCTQYSKRLIFNDSSIWCYFRWLLFLLSDVSPVKIKIALLRDVSACWRLKMWLWYFRMFWVVAPTVAILWLTKYYVSNRLEK